LPEFKLPLPEAWGEKEFSLLAAAAEVSTEGRFATTEAGLVLKQSDSF
jgi:hypothetical protein